MIILYFFPANLIMKKNYKKPDKEQKGMFFS